MGFIYGEIKGQYDALELTQKLMDESVDSVRKTMEGGSGRIVFIGCGSSFYVARSAALITQIHLLRASVAIPAGDLLIHMDTYVPMLWDASIVVLSRSGETSEVIMAIEGLRSRGVPFRLLSFLCVEGSTLSGMSDTVLEMPWAFDRSVCQTRSVSCLYFSVAYLAARLSGDRTLCSCLEKAVKGGDAFMARNEDIIRKIAEKPWTHAVVIGDAELSGICEEGALAFKEICQLPSNYYHVLDERHGPMVLVGPETLVLAAVSDPSCKLELELIKDTIARGALALVYTDMPAGIDGAVNICFGEPIGHVARGIPFIAICQMTAYYKSFETGVNPDEPSGLSPWIRL